MTESLKKLALDCQNNCATSPNSSPGTHPGLLLAAVRREAVKSPAAYQESIVVIIGSGWDIQGIEGLGSLSCQCKKTLTALLDAKSPSRGQDRPRPCPADASQRAPVNRERNAAIRQWCAEQNITISARGRIPEAMTDSQVAIWCSSSPKWLLAPWMAVSSGQRSSRCGPAR
jgi:hypothetical protein